MQIGQNNDFTAWEYDDAEMMYSTPPDINYPVSTLDIEDAEMGIAMADLSQAPVYVADVEDAEAGVYMRAAVGQPITPMEATGAGIDVTKAFQTVTGAILQFKQMQNAQGQPVYVARPVTQPTQQAQSKWLVPAIIGALFLSGG